MLGQPLPSQMFPLGLPPDDADGRFTVGLVVAVANVLADHRYPDIVRSGLGLDFAELRQQLGHFVYGPTDDYTERHAASCAVWSTPWCDCNGGAR